MIDGCGHADLLFAHREAGDCPRERTVGAEDVFPLGTCAHWNIA
jgi:hypothetical protein